MRKVFLVYVDASDKTQNNKYYNMEELGDQFKVEYGRIGSTKTELFYPISKWNSTYSSKVKKGYKDISDLKEAKTGVSSGSGNSAFDEFYDTFQKYTGASVRRNYVIESCTPQQILQAQTLLNQIVPLTDLEQINKLLLELYKVIPRRMSNVRDYLVTDITQINPRVLVEQNAIDSMDSSNITQVSNPFLSLGITFETPTKKEVSFIQQMFEATKSSNNVKIHKIFKSVNISKEEKFHSWIKTQKNKNTKLLIHGTRNPNIFSILKSGLLIRPTNAVSYAGSAYNDGIYLSDSFTKSLGYTGGDPDKIFFLNICHQGNPYNYKGRYYDSKDISRAEMTYEGLTKKGYDSLHVHAGDGLLRDEFVFYKSEQVSTNFIVWLK